VFGGARAGDEPGDRDVTELVVIRAGREFDYDTVRAEEAKIARASRDAGTVVLDLSETEIFGTAGLGAVIRSSRRLAAQGKRLVAVAPRQSPARRLFEIASLQKLVDIREELPSTR
jgi:anti-anti-sigma factor